MQCCEQKNMPVSYVPRIAVGPAISNIYNLIYQSINILFSSYIPINYRNDYGNTQRLATCILQSLPTYSIHFPRTFLFIAFSVCIIRFLDRPYIFSHVFPRILQMIIMLFSYFKRRKYYLKNPVACLMFIISYPLLLIRAYLFFSQILSHYFHPSVSVIRL